MQFHCPDCGNEICRSGIEPSQDAIPVCFSCFLNDAVYPRKISISESDDGVELWVQADSDDLHWSISYRFDTLQVAKETGELLAEKIRVVLLVELTLDDQYIIFGARNRNDTERLRQLIQEDPLSSWIKEIHTANLKDLYSETPSRYDGESLLTRGLCWRLATWRGCDYPDRFGPGGQQAPRKDQIELEDVPCIFNSRRGLSHNKAEQLQSDLANQFVGMGGFESVETLGDIRTATSEWMPVSAHIFPRIAQRLQNYARDNMHVLSPRSRAGIKANQAGQEFESTFREICDQYDLACWSASKLFSVRWQLRNAQKGKPEYLDKESYEDRLTQLEAEYAKLPDRAKEIANKVSDSSGFPDFVVWGDDDSLTRFVEEHSDGLQRSDSVLIVEVKYTADPDETAYFTDAQKERIPELRELDADVYIFRGTSEEYWLKRPSL